MINADVILMMVRSFTNRAGEIDQDKFLDMVEGLNEEEIREVLNIISQNNMSVTEDVEINSHEIYNYSSLQKLTNEELCVMYQNGNQAALDALCMNNTRLVHKIAIRVLKEYKPEILTEEDLYVEGNLGLMKAAERFDVSMDNRFSTYACWWIRQAITREVINNGYGMRLPVHIFEQVVQVNKCRKVLHGGSILEIKNMLQNDYYKYYSEEHIEKLIMYAEQYLNTSSLNKVVGENDGDTEIMDFVSLDLDVAEEAIAHILRDEIENVLSTLTEKENQILHLRYGLDTNEPMTLEEVGRRYHVTRERIRQIEAKALRKLRHPSRRRRLEGMIVA